MRTLLAVALLAFTVGAHGADGFQPAAILDASTHVETFGTVVMPVNTVTLRLGDLVVTADYYTALKNGPNVASALVVGDTVQAKLDGKKLLLVLPNGKKISADITRRARADLPAPAQPPQ